MPDETHNPDAEAAGDAAEDRRPQEGYGDVFREMARKMRGDEKDEQAGAEAAGDGEIEMPPENVGRNPVEDVVENLPLGTGDLYRKWKAAQDEDQNPGAEPALWSAGLLKDLDADLKYEKELADKGINTYEKLADYFKELKLNTWEHTNLRMYYGIDTEELRSVHTYEELKAHTKQEMRLRDNDNEYFQELEARYTKELEHLDTVDKMLEHYEHYYKWAYGEEPNLSGVYSLEDAKRLLLETMKNQHDRVAQETAVRRWEEHEGFEGTFVGDTAEAVGNVAKGTFNEDRSIEQIHKLNAKDEQAENPLADPAFIDYLKDSPMFGEWAKEAFKEDERDQLEMQKTEMLPPDSDEQEKAPPPPPVEKSDASSATERGVEPLRGFEAAPIEGEFEGDATAADAAAVIGDGEIEMPPESARVQAGGEVLDAPAPDPWGTLPKTAPFEGDAASRLTDDGEGALPTDDLGDEAFSGEEEGEATAAAPAAEAGDVDDVQGEAPVQNEAQEYQGIDTQEQSTSEAAPGQSVSSTEAQWSVDRDELLNPYEDDPSPIPKDELLNPYEDDPVVDS